MSSSTTTPNEPPSPRRPIGSRRSANRKLRQRRPLRARLPSVRDLVLAVGRLVRRAIPGIAVLLGTAVIACGLFVGYGWLRTSPRFGVRHVDVQGTRRVPTGEVLRRADIPAGANVFALPLREVERRIAESPWVERVAVSRELPDGLEVRVVEREAAAVVLLGGTYLADRTGRPFKRARIDAGEAEGLVVVTGLDRALFRRDAEAGAALVRAALDVVGHWRTEPDRPAVGEVHIDRNGMTLYTQADATAVKVGRAAGDELTARFRRFDVIWSALSPEERAVTKTIHLDSPSRPDRVTVGLADTR